MVIDDKHLIAKDAIRRCGAESAHRMFQSKREQALDRDDQDEADRWETMRLSVRAYVARRRRRYNLFAFAVGGVLALFPAVYGLAEFGFDNAAIIFGFFTLAIYLLIRFIDQFLYWGSGHLLLAAVGSFFWQVYVWLREARWPGLSIGDAFAWIGINLSYVSVEGWEGISEIANAVSMWIFTLSLPLGCLLLGLIFGAAGILMTYLDIPKMEESEEF